MLLFLLLTASPKHINQTQRIPRPPRTSLHHYCYYYYQATTAPAAIKLFIVSIQELTHRSGYCASPLQLLQSGSPHCAPLPLSPAVTV